MIKQIGRRIYYDKATGNVILDKGEQQGAVVETTVEQDIVNFTALSMRNRETFGFIQLAYGQYAEDFSSCIGVKVNLTTLSLEFVYGESPTISQKPLIEQVKELRAQTQQMNEDLLALSDFVTGGV